VLVPHTDKFYVAKALKAEKRPDGVWYYLLHYNGWNKKWDEWVEAPGLVKYDAKLVRSEDDKKGDDAGAPAKKRRTGGGTAAGDEVGPLPEFNLPLPTELRELLIGDWERSIKHSKPRPLPCKPVVADVLRGYVTQAKAGKDDGSSELEEEVASGLQLYFDKALGQMLLYAVERPQYDEQVQAAGKAPSSMYGSEHLLRLLVKLPELLPMSSLPADNYGTLELRLANFVSYLAEKRGTVFAK
jgi:mortality factor 4-like protein 1